MSVQSDRDRRAFLSFNLGRTYQKSFDKEARNNAQEITCAKYFRRRRAGFSFSFSTSVFYIVIVWRTKGPFLWLANPTIGGCRRQDIICQAQAWWRLYNHVVKLLYCCQCAYVTGIQRHSLRETRKCVLRTRSDRSFCCLNSFAPSPLPSFIKIFTRPKIREHRD